MAGEQQRVKYQRGGFDHSHLTHAPLLLDELRPVLNRLTLMCHSRACDDLAEGEGAGPLQFIGFPLILTSRGAMRYVTRRFDVTQYTPGRVPHDGNGLLLSRSRPSGVGKEH